MRPVGAPDDAVGIGRDQRLGERDAVGIIRAELRGAVGAGNLHIGLARLDELHEIGKAGLLDAERGLRAAEMIEHDRHRRGHDQILDRRDHRHVGIDLHVPAARLHALDGIREPRPGDIRIVDAAGCEIEADAANAGLAHQVEIALRRLVVDHGDAARGRSARRHAEQRGRVVGAVDRGRDDHHALHVQRLVQRGHFLRRGQFGRIDAAGEEREFRRVGMDMGVAIAGAGGNVEIHRRRRLRRFGGGGSVLHDHSGRDRGKHHTASRQHWCSPWIMLLIVDVRTGACPSTSAFLPGAGRCFARAAVGRLSGEVRRGKGAVVRLHRLSVR